MKDVKRGKELMRRLVLMVAAALLVSLPAVGATPADRSGAGEPLYVFRGRGRAHGVGLCMDGVLYRALEGRSYRDIISHYYTGVTFGRVDDNQPIRVKCRDGRIRAYSMRDYLYRLTEEPESYPFEGLKVLHVAARTYALSCIARRKHADEGFDICSSGNCCQAFDENKVLSRFPNNRAAVDATSGEVILYEGKVITAAYCGSCGGHSENSEDVWNARIPYLRGKPDPYCQRSPRFAWTVSMRKSDLETKLNAHPDTRIGSLLSIDLSSRTPGGRVKTARLVGSLGAATVSGNTLAARLGLQSTLFELVPCAFDEYLLVLNPNREPTVLTITFMQPDGSASDHIVEIAGQSRYTLKVNDYVQFREVSARIISELPVIAERAMYFNYQGKDGGSCCTGVTGGSGSWYFAEGYTGGHFDTYILIENPATEAAELRLSFMLPGGVSVERTVQAPPLSRVTVKVDDVPGLEDTEVSTSVESTNGVEVVAERSVYFDYFGRGGGHAEPGSPEPAGKWYLAEGYTGGHFDTYVLLLNPGTKKALVDATFMREDGENIVRTYRVEPRSRFTIAVDRLEGLEDACFSTRLVSRNGAPIVAERTMYFDHEGREGGHAGRGVTSSAEEWYFAEGYTGGMFDTYVLIQNPNPRPAEVLVVFTRPGGVATEKEYTVPGRSRFTVHVDEIEGLADKEVSTSIRSSNGVGVIAERAMYFNYRGGFDERGGGHDTPGVEAPSTRWYFAEGYTGH